MTKRVKLDSPGRLATRPRCRPTPEALESRLLLSTITWGGGGDGKVFEDPKNWVGGSLPGPSDDAVIDLAAPVVIQLPSDGLTINSLTQQGGSLAMSSGSFAVKQGLSLTGATLVLSGGKLETSGLDLTGGTYDDNGGTIADPFGAGPTVILTDSTLDDGPNASTAASGGELEGACILEGSVPAHQSLQVLTANPNDPTTLTVEPGAVNGGTITLLQGDQTSATTPINITVAGTGTFTNTGTLTCDQPSTLSGNFVNQGTFDLGGHVGPTQPTTLAAGTTIVNQAKGTLAFNGCTVDATAARVSIVNQPGGLIEASASSKTGCAIEVSPGTFVNEGTLTMGGAGVATVPNPVVIEGNYTQTSTGILNVELSDLTGIGILTGRLDVTGAATLAGSVEVTLLSGFVPTANETFDFLSYASAIGGFSSYTGTRLSNGLTLRLVQTATDQSFTTAPPPTADLSIAVKAQPAGLLLGGTITYTATITDTGPNDAQGVVVTDTLPQGVTPGAISTTAGTYTLSGDVVTLTIPTLANGSSATLTIAETPSAAGTYTDSASVASTGTSDDNAANSSEAASVVVPPPEADVSVTLSGPSATTTIGLLGFTATVTNVGPDPAVSTVLIDTLTLPAGATISSEKISGGTISLSGDVVTANLGTVLPGSVVTLTVLVAATSAGTFADSASAHSSTADPNMANNSATLTQAVRGQATASLALSAGFVAPGRPVTLAATVAAPPGFATASGTVTFLDGTAKLGTATLDASGRASLVVSSLRVGTHPLTVAYSGDANYQVTASPTAHLRVGVAVNGDFDGDGKSDIAIYDQTTATFVILYSGGGSRVQSLGNSTHVNIPVTGDFDGDGKTDIAIYDQTASTFYVAESGGGAIVQPFGNSTHVNVPLAGDFDGDGKTDLAIYDQTASTFYALESGGGTLAQHFGNPSDGTIPLVADLDGDGRTDLVIYDEALGEFFALESGGGTLALPFGTKGHNNRPI